MCPLAACHGIEWHCQPCCSAEIMQGAYLKARLQGHGLDEAALQQRPLLGGLVAVGARVAGGVGRRRRLIRQVLQQPCSAAGNCPQSMSSFVLQGLCTTSHTVPGAVGDVLRSLTVIPRQPWCSRPRPVNEENQIRCQHVAQGTASLQAGLDHVRPRAPWGRGSGAKSSGRKRCRIARMRGTDSVGTTCQPQHIDD